MENITFTFQGSKYSGYLISSTSELPHYHWFYLNDELLIRKIGDCVSFSMDMGGNLVFNYSYSEANLELINIIKQTVELLLKLK